MKVLNLKIEKCGECPHYHEYDYQDPGTARKGYCMVASRQPNTGSTSPCLDWCPLPDAEEGEHDAFDRDLFRAIEEAEYGDN